MQDKLPWTDILPLNLMNPILSPQALISHFMTYGGPGFIKIIQKNNTLTCISLPVLCGGQDKPAWAAYLPGLKITRMGSKISGDSSTPGSKLLRGAR